VYWAERDNADEPLHFRQFLEVKPGEKVLLVDDIFRTGSKLTEIKALVERQGGEVVALAVVVYQPHPGAKAFGTLPFFYLAKLDAVDADNANLCEMCKRGVPLTKVRV
jgi:orotate phosphoribosyltransferase